MKRPVMRDLYAVAVAFLGPHCVKWWRRYLAQGIAGLEKPQPSPQAFTINENRHLRSRSDSGVTFSAKSGGKTYSKRVKTTSFNLTGNSNNPQSPFPESGLNRPGFPGECFICELRLPDHRFSDGSIISFFCFCRRNMAQPFQQSSIVYNQSTPR